MTLKEYKAKRTFTKTKEPKPKKKRSVKSKPIFVVQKHDARRLHYDFRLEHRGMLLSWAIPKGPSMNPHDKRLAVHVEDHPLDYATFEGEIPEGEYGAGTVEIWDNGIFLARDTTSKKESEQKIAKGLKKGHIAITLLGNHLKGDFDLIHLKNADKENQWILVKKKDQYASTKATI